MRQHAHEGDQLDVPVMARDGRRTQHRLAASAHPHGGPPAGALAPDIARAGCAPTRCRPASARWSTGRRAAAAGCPVTRAPPVAAAQGCPRLPRGRHGLPAGVVARSQRTRIIYGTAEVMMAKGYANATVADIVAHGGSREGRLLRALHRQAARLPGSAAAPHPVHPRRRARPRTSPRRSGRSECGAASQTLIAADRREPGALASAAGRVLCRRAGRDPPRRGDHPIVHDLPGGGLHYRPEAAKLPRLCSRAISGRASSRSSSADVARGEAAALRATAAAARLHRDRAVHRPEEARRLVEDLKARSMRGLLNGNGDGPAGEGPAWGD